MTEDESYKMRPGYMLGAIETLQAILLDTVCQLPERAMSIVAESAMHQYQQAKIRASEADTDIARDYRDAAYEIATCFREAVERQIDELQDGGRIRTVQPFPIAPENWIDAERGF